MRNVLAPHKNLCIKLRHFGQDNRIEQDDIIRFISKTVLLII